MNRTWKSWIIGAVSLVVASAQLALADPIDNPGNFTLNLENPHTFLDFGPGAPDELRLGDGLPGSADLDGTAASDGTIGYLGASTTSRPFQPIGGATLNGQLQISGFAGTLNASTGLYDLTMTARVRFTGTAVPGPCYTPYFDVNFTDSKSWAGLTSAPYDQTAGELFAVVNDFVVPALPDDSCGPNTATINGLYNLGEPAGTPGMKLELDYFNPILMGS